LRRPLAALAALLVPAVAWAAAAPEAPPLPAPAAQVAADAAPESAGTTDDAALAEQAIAAYNASDYATAVDLAGRYVDRARHEGRGGRRVAEVLFVLGHARYEIRHQTPVPWTGDYRAEVVTPLEESFRVVQDNPGFRTLVLANAWFDLWNAADGKDAAAEEMAHWYLLKSIESREREVRQAPADAPERERLARFRLLYIDRCLELARRSATPDLYLYRIRAAALRGYDSPYADRFRQVLELTYFDGGNMRAAALFQFALNAAEERGRAADDVVARFQEAAEACRLDASRAEIDRQTADYLAVFDLPERRAQAADFARRAWELNPADAEIRRQYGSALHMQSFAAYARGEFEEALRLAQIEVTFDWQGIELGYFDLSRAAAELGRAEEAIRRGEEAYRTARLSAAGQALQPFAQNLVNVLRQFGEEEQAMRIVAENSTLGVH
jgi:hypothetical protein